MKKLLLLIISVFSVSVYAQQITLEEWDKEATVNIRLLPKYGHQPKSVFQKVSDNKFVTTTIQQKEFKGNRTLASDHSIKLGFSYLHKGDVKTAMYRFNQAYLLDSLNANIYWGYGAVYMALGAYDRGKAQYEEGLKHAPKNTNLLTDYATYFMSQYYLYRQFDEEKSQVLLDSAISFLTKSYKINKKEENTLYKLSICYWLKEDCKNAWKHYNECKKYGGKPITEDYTRELTECSKNKN